MIRNSNRLKSIITGGGVIGRALAEQLVHDGYSVTVIDRDADKISEISNSLDVFGVQGNGASYALLKNEVDAAHTDLFIAVTDSDETNILACITAHMLGAKHTVARIRDVEYANQHQIYREELGISNIINPEYATAKEVQRTLHFPAATRVELFAGGRAELAEMCVEEEWPLVDKTLIEINQGMGINLLICAVARDGEVFVPKGDTVIKAKDVLYLTGSDEEFRSAIRKLKIHNRPVKSVMIAGGGRVSYYLCKELKEIHLNTTVLEYRDTASERIAQEIPGVSVMKEDALKYLDDMSESDIANTDAFVAITSNDEYNLVSAMYAESQGIPKVISRISAKSRVKVLSENTRICTISREDVAADRIIGYARSILNAKDNEQIESLCRLMDGKVEFTEFHIDERTPNLGVPIKNLTIKKNMLLAAIIRRGKVIVPRGNDCIMEGDNILVCSIHAPISKPEDIFA